MNAPLSSLSRLDFIGAFLLRLGLGSSLAYLGFPLFVAGPEAWKELGSALQLVGIDFLALIWGLVAAMILSFGGVMIIAGLFTRFVSLLATIVFGFALAQQIHSGQEIETLIATGQAIFATLALAFIGPGRLSLDRRGI